MANHHKPTKEELKAGMEESLEKLDNIPEEDKPKDPPEEEKEPVTPPTPPEEESEEQEEPEQEEISSEDKPKDPPEEEKEKPATDWEKKFKESSKEAQILGFKDKEMSKALAQADALPEPNDDEMKKLYPNWDDIDQVTRDLAKDRILNKQRSEIIKEARAKFKNVVDWEEKVDTFVADPAVLVKHPELEGKEADFKRFASVESHRGVDFEVLLLAFAGENAKNKPAKKKGQMFHSGSGGAKTKIEPKSTKLSIAESATLMKSNYKEYLRQLKAGNIQTAV